MMLTNLRFDGCSKSYKQELIEDCIQLRMSSGLVHLCLSAYGGEAGAIISVKKMKDFYLMVKAEEEDQISQIRLKDLERLSDMPLSFPERASLERSSAYIGMKLMWIVRQFLLGQKFPNGSLKQQEWMTVCHDLLDLITESDFLEIMFEIDPSTYF